MGNGKIALWSALAATAFTLVYFRGDIQRYIKMKRM
jgi:hypothetical protein